MTQSTAEVTALLQRMNRGDARAADALLPILYGELKQLARAKMNHQDRGHSLQPTALVHEAWIRLMGEGVEPFENRQHFLAVAARAMRSVLIDHARRNLTAKRGGMAVRIALPAGFLVADAPPDLLLRIDEAMTRLQAIDSRMAAVAEQRCFAGLSCREISELTDLPLRTTERAWRTARAWLRRELGPA